MHFRKHIIQGLIQSRIILAHCVLCSNEHLVSSPRTGIRVYAYIVQDILTKMNFRGSKLYSYSR